MSYMTVHVHNDMIIHKPNDPNDQIVLSWGTGYSAGYQPSHNLVNPDIKEARYQP